MLLKNHIAQDIAAGRISKVYRRWSRARVAVGSTLRTVAGVLEIVRVERVRLNAITQAAARSAGYASRAALLDELSGFEGSVYCITLTYRGQDPRIELRRRSRLTAQEIVELQTKLERLGSRSPEGPWALDMLRTIDRQPGKRAGDLAAQHGVERLRFKARVRQLKEPGLTESLKVGYRLSPRGRALLRRLDASKRRSGAQRKKS